MAENEVGAEIPQESAPQVEATPLHEQGVSKSGILSQLMGDQDYVHEVLSDETVDTLTAAPESPVEAVTPTDSVIPGVEVEKPADAPAEAKADDSEKDASTVTDAPDAGKFRVRGEDGSFVEAPPVKVEFRVGEKVYTKDVGSLVRMAYDGVAGQKAVAQNKQYEAEVIPRLQFEANQRIEQLQADFQAQLDLNAAILQDETGETWAKNHEKFVQSQSPQAVAERAQQEATSLRQTMAEQQAQQYTANIYATHIQPALNDVAQQCPDVSDHTKAGIIADLTKDLLVAGRIPPQRFPELVQRMQGPFVSAVRAEQQRFTQGRQELDAAVARAKAEAAAELRAAQAKQNKLVAPLVPVGSATSANVAKPLPPARNAREVLERINNRQ